MAYLLLVRPMKFVVSMVAATFLSAADWPLPKSPAVPAADGYVALPGAALSPTNATKYQAVFDATRFASEPTQLVPAINMAASELNALAAVNAPLSNARFVSYFMGVQSTAFSTANITRPNSGSKIQT